MTSKDRIGSVGRLQPAWVRSTLHVLKTSEGLPADTLETTPGTTVPARVDARRGAMARAFAAAVISGVAVVVPSSPARADEFVTAPAGNASGLRPIPGVREFTGRVIVRPWPLAALLARGLSADDAQRQDADARARAAIGLVAHVTETDEFLLAVPAGQDDAVFAATLRATGLFEYADPDWLVFPASQPSDPRFREQYHHRLLQSALAWDITTGSPSVILAMVDTGVSPTHPDLAPRLVPGYNAASALAQIDGGDISDIVGHGTMVAGAAGATGNNALGVSGVAWSISLMPVRASNLSNGAAALSTITAGARWAADHGARVVSVSYTGVQSPTVQTTGAYVRSAGLGANLVWAAGNSAQNLSAFDWPDVTIVGATGPDDLALAFSAFGTAIDCVAPGSDILTTTLSNGYAPIDGTSFSAPITAAALALLYSANPALTPAQAEATLLDACVDLGDSGDDALYGRGRINTHRALSILTRGLDSPIPSPDDAVTAAGEPILIDPLGNDFDPQGLPISIESFDLTSALGGLITRSVGSGLGGRDELLFHPGGVGLDSFLCTITNGIHSATALVSVRVETATLSDASSMTSALAGLRARYFDLSSAPSLILPDFALLASFAESVWTGIDFPSSDDDFADTFRSDNLAVLADGALVVPADGLYRLALESDDGSRLLLHDQEVVRNDGLHGMIRAEGVVALRAGAHPLRVEFFERRLSAGLRATIAGPGIAEQVLSGAWLARAAPDILDINADGSVDPDDLADFVSLFFAFDPRADFNGDGSIDPDDLADFIAAYFGR